MVCSFMMSVPWEMSGQSLGLSLPAMQGAESLFPSFCLGYCFSLLSSVQCSHTVCLFFRAPAWESYLWGNLGYRKLLTAQESLHTVASL